MWFTGRFSGAATVLVLDPSQVTGRPEEPGAFDGEVCVVDPGVAVAGLAPGEPEEPEDDPAEEEEEPAEELEPEPDEEPPEEEAPAEEVAVLVAAAEAPSSRVPVPLLHAVSESAPRTTVAAAPTKRMREVRKLNM